MKIYPVSSNNSIKRRNWQSSNCQENKTSLRKKLSREGKVNPMNSKTSFSSFEMLQTQPRLRANGLLRRRLRRAYSVNNIQSPSFVGQLPPVLNERHSYPVLPMAHNEKMGGEITTPRCKNAIISYEFKTIKSTTTRRQQIHELRPPRVATNLPSSQNLSEVVHKN